MHDIIFRNATVIDGTGSPAFQADVAIGEGHIVEIGDLRQEEGKQVIDAGGGVVAPGFIDMHSHADFSLPIWPTAESLVHQGITTTVAGQCGLTPAPLLTESREEVVTALTGFFGDFVKDVPWKEWASAGDYLQFLTDQGISLNLVPLVGQGIIRAAVMGFGEGRADRDQLARMKDLVAEAMAQGAIGISTGLIYPPGSFTSTEELIALAETVGDGNGYYFSHIRGESDTLLNAVEEAIQIGRASGTSVQVSHFKAAPKENWDKSSQALSLIEQAQAEGLDVSADMYPYTAGSTVLHAVIPP